jgi:hypothetical protein
MRRWLLFVPVALIAVALLWPPAPEVNLSACVDRALAAYGYQSDGEAIPGTVTMAAKSYEAQFETQKGIVRVRCEKTQRGGWRLAELKGAGQ